MIIRKISDVGGKWFIENIDAKLHPIKITQFIKKEKVKKKKQSKIFVRPIIIGIIGSFNCIGKNLNG